MKPLILFNKMTKRLMLMLFVISAFLGCKKNELLTRFSTDLALNANTVRLAATPASTKIQIFADGKWTVAVKSGADWLTLDKTEGSGKGYLTATVPSNEGNPARATEIYITGKNTTDTVVLQQLGLTQTLKFMDASINTLSRAGSAKTLITTNIDFTSIDKHVKYVTAGQTNWISNITYDGSYISFDTEKNTSPEAREAVLTLSHKNAIGLIIQDAILITQNAKAEYDDAILKDFSYVKNMLAGGSITENIYIEGIVLADKGNPNTALIPNQASNKHELDYTENGITVYIQSLDGTSGLRIRTNTPGDNLFAQNEKVKIWLKGTTLAKAINPSTATISDFPSINIIEKELSTTPLVAREKFMKDLVDNDIYTYVKLKDVEISIPVGSYFNTNYGYYARVSCYPVNIRDVNGNSMYMMMNDQREIASPYKSIIRNDVAVPQGSGAISGVLVHENYLRFGGELGDYAIRPMSMSEIVLDNTRSSGFSNVLVEWQKPSIEYTSSPTASKNLMSPNIGLGQLSQSSIAETNYTAIGATSAYNGLKAQGSGTNEQKGTTENDAWRTLTTAKWWNDSKNRGEAWLVKFSTTGVTKQLSMQLSGWTAVGGPRNFVVEWSTTRDMDSGTWGYITEYTFQDLVNFSNTLLTQTAAAKVVNFKLPTELLGESTVYIRMRLKDKIVGSSTSDTGGSFVSTTSTYLDHISIKYNK